MRRLWIFCWNFAGSEDAEIANDWANDELMWYTFNKLDETLAVANDDSGNPALSTFPSSKLNDDAVEYLFATADATNNIDTSTGIFAPAESLTSKDIFGTSSIENRTKGNTSDIMTT